MRNIKYRKRLVGFSRYLQRAFELTWFKVLCPYCSKEQKTGVKPYMVATNNHWLWKCKGCSLWFFYSPFFTSKGRQREDKEIPLKIQQLYFVKR